MEQFVSTAVDDNKMDWELWLQSADDFEDLRESLAKRGYSRLPNYSSPLYSPELDMLQKTNPDVKGLSKPKTMVRKRSD